MKTTKMICVIAVFACALAACSTKDWFDGGSGHHVGGDSTGTIGNDSTGNGNDSTGTGGVDSTGTGGSDSTLYKQDSLRIGVLLEHTGDPGDSIIIQVVDNANHVLAERLLSVNSITWRSPVVTRYNSAYIDSYTFLSFAGKFPTIKNNKCQVRIKRATTPSQNGAVYWYSSRGNHDSYPIGTSSVGASTDFSMYVYYHEYPFLGKLFYANTTDEQEAKSATLKKRKLSSEWAWQEFVLVD